MTQRPISVLLTHEAFPPDTRGGGEYVVLRIATGLQARGVRVKVLTTGDPAVTSHEGIATDRLPIGRRDLNLRFGRILAAARDVDLVHTFNYHACLPSLLAARHLSKPVVCSILALFGSAWRDMRGGIAGRLYESWERFLVSRRYDCTVFLSAPSLRLGLALGADPQRCIVNMPGIDCQRLACAETRKPFVLFAGKFDSRKGIHNLVAVARSLPEIPFHAVGWGDGQSFLRAANLPNLTITEERGGPRYLGLLRDALVLLFPSHAETFGIVLAEAMASGCAIVSSVDTMPFAGTLVAPGDEKAMIEALRRMWADQESTRELGRRNRTTAANWTWDAHIDHLMETYGSLLRAAQPAGARFA